MPSPPAAFAEPRPPAHDPRMSLNRYEWVVLLVNVASIAVFAPISLRGGNQEFLLYAGVIVAISALAARYQRRVELPMSLLWGLTAWGILHLVGGNLPAGDTVLYGVILVPLAPEWSILRYDQLVHAYGFGVATLVCHHFLRPYLREGARGFGLAVLIALMGVGVGAMNEVLEFVAVVVFPETGVGGYTNTLLDLVFNLIGATGAVVILALSQGARKRHAPG